MHTHFALRAVIKTSNTKTVNRYRNHPQTVNRRPQRDTKTKRGRAREREKKTPSWPQKLQSRN